MYTKEVLQLRERYVARGLPKVVAVLDGFLEQRKAGREMLDAGSSSIENTEMRASIARILLAAEEHHGLHFKFFYVGNAYTKGGLRIPVGIPHFFKMLETLPGITDEDISQVTVFFTIASAAYATELTLRGRLLNRWNSVKREYREETHPRFRLVDETDQRRDAMGFVPVGTVRSWCMGVGSMVRRRVWRLRRRMQ
jgi:hypothetical protein